MQLRRTNGLVSALVLVLSVSGLCGCAALLRGNAALEPPSQVAVECVNALVVGLHWAAPDRPGIVGFAISRDGMTIGWTSELYFTDASVAPQNHYSYSVTAIDRRGNPVMRRRSEPNPPGADPPGEASNRGNVNAAAGRS